MENFHLLGSLARDLHLEFRRLYYILLPVFFALALLVEWLKDPVAGPNVIELIKRTFISSLLLVGFVELTDALLVITNGIAARISDMSGLDTLVRLAGEKAKSYPMSASSVLLGGGNLLVGVICFLSYLFLLIARFLMIALYHFAWTFLAILSPLLLLLHLFTPKITLNLFRSLIEVASWQIVWAVLSVMLKSLPYADVSASDFFHLSLVVLNLVIAICMLLTPLVVHHLVGSGFTAMTSSIGGLAAAAVVASPARIVGAYHTGRRALSHFAPVSRPGGTGGPPPRPPPSSSPPKPDPSSRGASDPTLEYLKGDKNDPPHRTPLV